MKKKKNRIRNAKETLSCFIYLFKYCVLCCGCYFLRCILESFFMFWVVWLLPWPRDHIYLCFFYRLCLSHLRSSEHVSHTHFAQRYKGFIPLCLQAFMIKAYSTVRDKLLFHVYYDSYYWIEKTGVRI